MNTFMLTLNFFSISIIKGDPGDVEANYPDATVTWSKIRVGTIGSTYPSGLYDQHHESFDGNYVGDESQRSELEQLDQLIPLGWFTNLVEIMEMLLEVLNGIMTH